MSNLDRFSQPLPNETYFEDENPVCQCTHCEEDLYEGEWHFEADEKVFCNKECFTDWCIEEFTGITRILEGKK